MYGTCRAKLYRIMHVRETQKTEFRRTNILLFLHIELLKPTSWCQREGLIPFIAAITTYFNTCAE